MTIKPISIHPITMKIKRIKEKLDGLQDEYFELLNKWIRDDNEDDTIEDRHYRYRRMKEVQKDIIVFTNILRELSLEKSKQQLEEAFTPRLQQMLSQSLSENN